MSRVFFILIILLPLFTVPQNVLAVGTCSSRGITYTPTRFNPNPSIITMNFTINDPNTLSFLRGKSVRLNFGTGILPGQTSLSVPTAVNGNTFSLSLTDEALRGSGSHSGALIYSDTTNGNYTEACSQVNYTVDKQSTDCNIVTGDKVTPGGTLPFKFAGLPNTTYDILLSNPTNRPISTATTDSSGQGSSNITANFQDGDSFKIYLQNLSSHSSCSSPTVNVSIAAPTNITLPSGPVSQPGSTSAGNGGPPTTGAGLACSTAAGSGIDTALGCVPTELQPFIEGVLNFSFGIGGGIAFLLMVMGAFEMITSGGNPETLKHGQERFRDAIIGLLFIIFAVLLLKIIGVDILNIQGFGS